MEFLLPLEDALVTPVGPTGLLLVETGAVPELVFELVTPVGPTGLLLVETGAVPELVFLLEDDETGAVPELVFTELL